MQDFDFHKVTFLFWCFTGHNAFFCCIQTTKLHFFLMFRWSQCILLLSPDHKVTLLFDVSLVTMHSSAASRPQSYTSFWCFAGHNAFFCCIQTTKLHFFLMFRWSQCILLLHPDHKVTLLFDVSLVTMHSSESSYWIVISFFVDHCDNGTCVLYCKHVCCRDRRWGAFFSPSPCVTWFYHRLPGGACRFSPLVWSEFQLGPRSSYSPYLCPPPPPPPPPHTHTHTHSPSLSLPGHYHSHHHSSHAYCPVPVSSPL